MVKLHVLIVTKREQIIANCCCLGDSSRIGGAIVRHEARVGRDQAARPRHQPAVGGCERENSEIVTGQLHNLGKDFEVNLS